MFQFVLYLNFTEAHEQHNHSQLGSTNTSNQLKYTGRYIQL